MTASTLHNIHFPVVFPPFFLFDTLKKKKKKMPVGGFELLKESRRKQKL
jgi:hypothetical protein